MLTRYDLERMAKIGGLVKCGTDGEIEPYF